MKVMHCKGALLLLVGTLSASAFGQSSMTARQAYPTGDTRTSILMIERIAPVDVRAGSAMEYRIRLTNLTDSPLTGIELTERLPGNFTAEGMSPEPSSRNGGEAVWQIARIDRRGVHDVTIRGKAGSSGAIEGCATVRLTTEYCGATKIVQPALQLTKEAPPEVMQCDPIPLRIVVTNTGTGVAEKVQVTDTLPDGWTTTGGQTELTFEAGNLFAGQSREFTATVRAARTGNFTNTASATEAGGLSAEATATTRVVKPALQLSKQGPDVRYLGRPAEFTLTVRNTGDAVARNLVVTDTVPGGLTFLAASDGGKYANGRVTWRLGELPAGQSRSVTVKLNTFQIGRMENTARAEAYCANADARAVLEVRGIPALLLEVVDLSDPIEVGGNVTYEITVLNQGSAAGTSIVIRCQIPGEQSYISADGPTDASTSGKVVTFAPLASLAPKATAKYRVTLKADSVQDVRFGVRMTADQLDSPVEETESTHQY